MTSTHGLTQSDVTTWFSTRQIHVMIGTDDDVDRPQPDAAGLSSTAHLPTSGSGQNEVTFPLTLLLGPLLSRKQTLISQAAVSEQDSAPYIVFTCIFPPRNIPSGNRSSEPWAPGQEGRLSLAETDERAVGGWHGRAWVVCTQGRESRCVWLCCAHCLGWPGQD